MSEPSIVIVDNTVASSRVVQNNEASTRLSSAGPHVDGTYNIKEAGSSNLGALVDVSTAGRMNNDVLKYSAQSGRWIPSANFIVLATNDPVPAGLRPGTLIFREQT